MARRTTDVLATTKLADKFAIPRYDLTPQGNDFCPTKASHTFIA
jgi:hypothetical protein